eukprot:14802269-Alexandrium_andersonii.AAC.1
MTTCPKCNPQRAQGLSVLQSASVRNPPCGNIASGIRSLNCAGPRTTSTLVPEAPRCASCDSLRADSESKAGLEG